MKKRIKSYSWSIWNNVLQVYVIDENDNEFIVATIEDVKEINADTMAQTILEELDYEII